MATWLEDIVTALGQLGGVASLDDLYAEVERLRGPQLTPAWKTTMRREILNHSSHSRGFKTGDVFYSVKGIGAGVWGLRSALKPTEDAIDLRDNGVPGRVLTQVYRVLRDSELCRQLKMLHKHRCQVCGEVLSLGDDAFYSEAHHLRPLGNPHRGPDSAANILVLCPKHHVLLDYGAIKLEHRKLLTAASHGIGKEFVKYHNEKIFRGRRNRAL